MVLRCKLVSASSVLWVREWLNDGGDGEVWKTVLSERRHFQKGLKVQKKERATTEKAARVHR